MTLLKRLLLRLFVLLGALTAIAWLVLARPTIQFGPLEAPPFLASPETLKAHVQKLSQEFIPRDSQHPENLNRASDFIFEEFKRANQRVEFQYFKAQGKEYRNVVSEYGAPNDVGTIVIGAHYDAYGELPGADDNASGVAGLLELGRLLSTQTLDSKITLVAYTTEEPPFFRTDAMGSAVHAASLKAKGEKVRFMISLEMIGFFSDEPGSQAYPFPLLHLFYPSRGNFIAIIGPATLSPTTIQIKNSMNRATSLPAVSINAPSLIPGIDFSDHRSYWRHGFDAVMISDTSFYRNLAYHTKEDTAERLNYDRMADVVNGVFAAILDVSNPG